jgi:hypothetical protein
LSSLGEGKKLYKNLVVASKDKKAGFKVNAFL